MFKVTVLAAPLGVLALGAQAADIASTIAEQEQFSMLAKVIEAAGLAKALEGEGPYTVFAPTDQAFERLPSNVQDALMNEENRDQLERMLQQHVVEGEEITASDVEGRQTEVETVAGDRLSVDGTGPIIVLLPSHGDLATEVGAESGMPVSEHQQEVLAEEPATEERLTAQDGDMPASPHQEQVLRHGPAAGQPSGEGMRATVTEADIAADNGIIHAIDAVLIPQSLLSTIERSGVQGEGDQAARSSRPTSRAEPF
jgi:uncharacterized surface protein with fasciclin (FAS1) repeats